MIISLNAFCRFFLDVKTVKEEHGNLYNTLILPEPGTWYPENSGIYRVFLY